MNESLPQFDMNARLVRQWVENLAQVVEILAREGDRAEWTNVAVFWVRLHGLLSELRSQYTGFLRLLKIDPVSQAAQPDSLLAHMLSVSRCIEPVRHAFNDDELIYGDYRRHTECHPTQASYGVRMTKSRKVNDRHGVPSLDGREFTVNELTAAIRRVLLAHQNEDAIAVAFARRIQDLMPPLVTALRRGAVERR
jgi:hypothetical protein